MRAAHFLALILIWTCPTMAQPVEEPRGRFPTAQPEEIKQKAQLVEALLTHSPVMARITDGGNDQVKSQASAARKLFERALEAIAVKDMAKANADLNDALRLIGEASRQVPDTTHTLARQREEYAALIQQIELFLTSYQRLQDRREIKKPINQVVGLDLDRIRTQVAGAEALEQKGDYVGANKILSEAHTITVTMLNKLVANETFVYDLRFASAAEEFRYELERHKSYEELIPIAVATLHPSADANKLIDRYFQQSEQLKSQARQQAEEGNHKQALQTMRDATEYLQKALQMVGIIVPQSMNN